MQSAQVIACSKHITLHLLQSRQPLATFNPHKGIVNCVHINHTSNYTSQSLDKVIASSGQDGRIVLVNALKPDNQVFQTYFHTQSSTSTPKLVSINAIMFSPLSHYIAAASSDSLVKVWDMKNHTHVFSTIKSHVASVNSLAWIKNLGIQKIQGDIIASASSIGDIFLHSVKTSNIIETLNTKNQQSVNQIKVSQSEGHCRLAACTTSGSVMMWDLRNIQKSTEYHCYFNNGKKSSVTSVSFSSFNPVLLASSSMDQTLTFYDINEKKSVKVITSEEPLTSINFHTDGHTLIAGSQYGSLFVYDLRKPSKPKDKLIGHESAIKHTLLVKEFEQPKPNMGNSRASNSSSVNSVSSKAKSIKSINQQPQPVQMNNFVQQPNKRLQTNSEKPAQIKRRQQSSVEAIDIKKQMSSVKLSTTGQQALKNAEQKSGFGKINPTTTAPSGYSYYSKPQVQSTIPSNTSSKLSQHSIPKPVSYEDNSSVKPPLYQQPKSHSLPVSRVQQPSILELRELIEERFQNLHMQMIHQFHLQHREMKQMITSLLIQDKKKNEKIKQLQAQIQRLKNNTY